MDHCVGERAGHAESFRSHRFAHEMGVGAADARGDGAQKIHVQAAWGQLKDFLKRVFGECADQGRLNRGRSGKMRRACQERRCAKEISLINVVEDFMLDAVSGLRNFNGALAYQVKRVARFAFAKNNFAGFLSKDANFWRDARNDIGVDACKQPIIVESLNRAGPGRRFHSIKSACDG